MGKHAAGMDGVRVGPPILRRFHTPPGGWDTTQEDVMAKAMDKRVGAKLPKGPKPPKAETMLEEDQANGKPLSQKQKGMFGSIVGRAKGAGRLPKG